MSDLDESSNERTPNDMSKGISSSVKDEEHQQHSFSKEKGEESNDSIEVKHSVQDNGEPKLFGETKLLRDTLDLLWNQTLEQRKVCQQLEQENDYLQDYISNLMTSSNVLEK